MSGAALGRELLAGLLAAALAAAIVLAPELRESAQGLVVAAVGCLTLWIAGQDLRSFTIPDGGVVALALLGAAWRIAYADGASLPVPGSGPLGIALDMALAGGSVWLLREAYFRSRGFDGIGFGDVKLAAAGGILVGAAGFASALLFASLAGLLLVAAQRVVGRPVAESPDRIAFGALLAPAFAAIWIAQQSPALAGFLP